MNKPILNYKGSIEFDEKVIAFEADKLRDYISKIQSVISKNKYSDPESSVILPNDESILYSSQNLAKEFSSENLKYIFLIGIGGSNLGTQAIYNAVRGQYDYLERTLPKVFFLDAISSNNINQINRIVDNEGINHDDFVIFFISKSGGTTETVGNLNLLVQVLSEYLENEVVKSRIITITDEDSKLWKNIEKENMYKLPHEKVGGRFSVFSHVGITPLTFIFEDQVEELIHGARVALEDCTQFEFNANPAMQSALITNLYIEKGIRINNSFFFESNLEFLGKWHRQLVGESLGKLKNKKGETVNTGITPIVSIGSTDLHSMLQLYIGGPNDKLTNFVFVKSEDPLKINESSITKDLVENLEGKSAFEINKAIYEGVKRSYVKNERAFMEIIFQNNNLFSLGYFMQFKMLEVMYLAHLMNINAFDQPSVEDYKEETRELLKG